MLADAGGDDRLATRMTIDLLDDIVRLDAFALAIVVVAIALLQLRNLAVPFGVARCREVALCIDAQRIEVAVEYADVEPVGLFHLADLGRIDVKMCHPARLRRKLIGNAGDPVVEA